MGFRVWGLGLYRLYKAYLRLEGLGRASGFGRELWYC